MPTRTTLPVVGLGLILLTGCGGGGGGNGDATGDPGDTTKTPDTQTGSGGTAAVGNAASTAAEMDYPTARDKVEDMAGKSTAYDMLLNMQPDAELASIVIDFKAKIEEARAKIREAKDADADTQAKLLAEVKPIVEEIIALDAKAIERMKKVRSNAGGG